MGTDIFPQTAVVQYPDAAFPGQLFDPGQADIVSGSVSESAGVEAGIAVILDTPQSMLPGYTDKVKYPVDANSVIYGFTVLQVMKQPSSPRFALHDTVAIVRKGRIWTSVASTVNQGDDVYVTFSGTKGQIRPDAGANAAVRARGAKVLRGASTGGVALVDCNFPMLAAEPGGIETVTAVKTSAYTPAYGEFVPYDTTGGAFTITLPDAAGHAGQVIQLTNASASTTALTVATTNSETINGASTQSLVTAKPFTRTFRSDGANWYMY